MLIIEKNKKKIEAAIKADKLSFSIPSKPKWNTSSTRESSVRMQDTEESVSFIYEAFELDPFAPSTIEDPFLKKLVKIQLIILYINI